jgi:CMP-N-acetylneuraminic acid synthetase
MKFMGYVTVRLDSKRVAFKSIREIGGKPLVNYAISTLNQVEEISEIVLYCSQEKIKDYIDPTLPYNFIKRPFHLDSDDTSFNDILLTIIDEMETDYIIFLSCTSPFIKSQTIRDMIHQIVHNNFDSAFTAFNVYSFCWFDNSPLNYDPSKVPRTQDLKPVIVETSGLYIFSKQLFQRYKRRIGFKPYIKIVDIFEGWDIDTIEDLKMAELIARWV